ncbi:MAG: hypothetical protein ABJA02_06340 [Acidobacteriota bacterium]
MPPSGTPVQSDAERLGQVIGACSAAADDLAATRKLTDALESENKILTDRLETEKRATYLLGELNATRKAESDALRVTVAAKSETIRAKDAVIAEQEKLIDLLKKKRSSPWRRIGDIIVGAALGTLLK